jgi:hypothetical protein
MDAWYVKGHVEPRSRGERGEVFVLSSSTGGPGATVIGGAMKHIQTITRAEVPPEDDVSALEVLLALIELIKFKQGIIGPPVDEPLP